MRPFRRAMVVATVLSAGLGMALARNHAGDVFSLEIWKLTIPMDDDGDGKADEVTQPTLRYFEDPDFFHLSDTKDSIVFRARCGAPTTGGSSYPRCELREMEPGGEEKASWGTNDGFVHNMTINLAINAVPEVKKHVVCAQIHDAEDDLFMVRLEGRKLFIERNGLEPAMLDEDYVLGEFFDLMIIADSGRIRALYESEEIMDWEVEADGLYFKAGCYVQSNTAKGDSPDAFGEVEIRKLFVTHKRQ